MTEKTFPASDPERALIALGSNLAFLDLEGVQLLLAALNHLEQAGLSVHAVSRFWRTAPWPPGSCQPHYVNACAEVGAESLTPQALWAVLMQAERAFGRVRTTPNAPRTLDLDLIGFGDRVLTGPDLLVPHPRAHERAFVMLPLAEIAPDWVHPTLGRPVRALAAAFQPGPDVAPLD